jgi:putative hemolysin
MRPSRPIDTAAVMPPGRARSIYRWVQPLIEWVFGFPRLFRHYDACAGRGLDAEQFAQAYLERVKVTWSIPPQDLEKLRAISGPLLVAINHPFGGIDALAFVQLLERIRPGAWRFVANQVMITIPELSGKLIAVDPLSTKGNTASNSRGIAQSIRCLRQGGLLGIMPAGRVSRRDPVDGVVRDRLWTPHAATMAARTGAHIAVLNMAGQNSGRFLAVPMTWVRFRALMLAREMASPICREMPITLRALLSPEEAAKLADDPKSGESLHRLCYTLPTANEHPK